jgi:hypothetical protein
MKPRNINDQLTKKEKDTIYFFMTAGVGDVMEKLYPDIGMGPEILASYGGEDGHFDKIELSSAAWAWAASHFYTLVGQVVRAHGSMLPLPDYSAGIIVQFLLALKDEKLQSAILSRVGEQYYESDGHYERGMTPAKCANNFRAEHGLTRKQIDAMIEKINANPF